ncbi:MAG: ATP-binding protein [Hellea sp.]
MDLGTKSQSFSGREISAQSFFDGLDQLPTGFSVYDEELNLIFANKAVRRNLPILYANLDTGLPLLDSIASQIKEFHPDMGRLDCSRRAASIVAAIRAESAIEVTAADGRVIHSIYKRLETGQYILVSTDVTQRVQNAKALLKAQQDAESADLAKTEFLANMSHEIRTPLSGVFMAAQLLQQQLRTLNHPELSSIADILVGSTTHLSGIINNVLDLSKIEAGQVDINVSENSVADMIRSVKSLQDPVAKAADLELKLVLDPKLPERLFYDDLRVRQCLTNLVSNALKFTPSGSVTIAALFDLQCSRVTLHVVDTGIGIALEKQPQVFDQFIQLEPNTLKSDVQIAESFPSNTGTGLGLAISRKLARLMGGDVQLTSELGKGSIFTLTFTGKRAEAATESIITAA